MTPGIEFMPLVVSISSFVFPRDIFANNENLDKEDISIQQSFAYLEFSKKV